MARHRRYSGRPLKVLFLSYHPAHYRDRTLSLVQRSRIVDLDVAYLFESADYWHPYWERGGDGLEYTVLESSLPHSPSRHLDASITSSIAESDVAFITGLTHWTSRLAFLSSLCLRKPVVFVSDMTPTSTSPRQSAMMRVLVRVVSAVWVPGAASRSLWQEAGLSPSRVFEGCYCLDSRYLRETQKKHLEWRDTQRRAIGIEPEDPVALFVGRMVAERDIPCLMAGFRSAVMSFPRAKLVIVGDGPYRSWATEFCRNQGLSDSVRFLNPVPYEDLMSVYAAADIYVQPSSREPYSLSTAQAAVMGLPVVSSDAVGAVDDYVVDGATGLVFHSGDAQAMADALCSLLGQPSVAAEMGESACAVASERSAEWAARQFILAALAAGERRLAGFS